MQDTAAYRAQAEMCVRQAEHARSPKHRFFLLQVAQSWVRLADEAEAMRRLETDLDEAPLA